MQHESIQINGARENNLKDISLEIPRHQVVVVTGVSGSGKSSLVFDTIAAESQRQLNETFTTFVRNRLPRYGQPDADRIAAITPAIVINQKRIGGNSRSTVGTITDIYSLLRLLYSRAATPWVGYSNAFSFNDPAGMCPDCEGLGRRVQLDLDALLDRSRSLNEGAIRFPAFGVGMWFWKLYAHSGHFDNDKPLGDYDEQEWQTLLHGTEGSIALDSQAGPMNSPYEGIVEKFDRIYMRKEPDDMSAKNRAAFKEVTVDRTCPTCDGRRLRPEALAATLNGRNIAELTAAEVGELRGFLSGVDDASVRTVVESLDERLEHLEGIGLGYLSLNRETSTLSGGESQRIKMVRHLSSSLIEMTYIFDEPTIGLHPRDVHRLTELLRRLRDNGNTVLVVEHDRDVITIADHVVDMGPRAGEQGGEVVFEGSVDGLRHADTLTGRHLGTELPLKRDVRAPTGWLAVTGARLHNLKDVSVEVPTGVLTAVTGVAGSGKSTLIHDVFVPAQPSAVLVDQSAVSTSRRSNLATYTGFLDEVRRLFAKANGVKASLFTSNSTGGCPNCQGLGVIYTDLAFLDPMITTCEVCEGRRFTAEVLEYTLRGLSIADVLDLTVAHALDFFTEQKIAEPLRGLREVGLDYLRIGQPLSTLSGGECQRVKLSIELRKTGSVYVLDEPTTGLHMSDIELIVGIMNTLVDRGNSVVVIEHNLDVVKNADWVIDLGPDGGSAGGEIVFTGTPEQLLEAPGSYTGEYLRRSMTTDACR